MQLMTPITGTTIEVADDKAERFIARGFVPVTPKKKPARRRRAKTVKEQ